MYSDWMLAPHVSIPLGCLIRVSFRFGECVARSSQCLGQQLMELRISELRHRNLNSAKIPTGIHWLRLRPTRLVRVYAL